MGGVVMAGDIRKINTRTWIRSSRCGSGNCVELHYAEDHLLIRDSKGDDAALLEFDRDSWFAFLKRYHAASS
jgi:hypothetical protein